MSKHTSKYIKFLKVKPHKLLVYGTFHSHMEYFKAHNKIFFNQ